MKGKNPILVLIGIFAAVAILGIILGINIFR